MVPTHWELQCLRQVGRFSKGSGGTKDDEVPNGLPCVRYGDLYTKHSNFIQEPASFISASNAHKYTPIVFGDVLFAASGETIDEIGKSAVNLLDSTACCGGDVILFRLQHEMDARYIGYTMDCRPVALQKSLGGRGITVMHVYPSHLKGVLIPLPPLAEQAAIVRFLDHADRRIQRYTRAKEKLIALLEEQKQAVIHQAVTGQIDARTGKPYPGYKDSGVEWLGRVPTHWRVRRLKFVATIASGQVDPRLEEYRDKVLIAPNHIVAGCGQIERLETARAQGADSGKYVVRAGDVVYSKIRPHLRKGAIAPVHGLCSADMYPIRVLEDEVKAQYFLHLLLSEEVTRYTVECSMRVAMPKINRQSLGNCWITYPDLEEQSTVLDWIGDATAELEVLVDSARQEIDLLVEYRTRLIADVVTGKLDVREAAAKLPDIDTLEGEDASDGYVPDVEPSLDELQGESLADAEA